MTRRDTAQQRAIREAIQAAGRPLSIEEIKEAASAGVPTLGIRTVYRVVSRLLEDGVIAPVALPGRPDRYECAGIAATHHHHFRCDRCDRMFDVDACPGGLGRMLPDGFQLEGHELLLWGRCADCGSAAGA
ncbi:MAG: transcriptional repressor [Planctomycetota bacterium]